MPRSRLSSLCLALALVFALAPLGCGGNVEVLTGVGGGAGGSGGSGTGAAGGSGGSGGASQGTCSPEQEALAYSDPPQLGLSSPPASPTSAVVVTVSPTSIEYILGPDAPIDTFSWEGPSLLNVFMPGETVTVGATFGWQFIASAKIAATYTTYEFVPPGALPAVPMSKVPPLGYATQCSFPETGGACEQPPASVDVLAVRVGTGSDAAEVAVGDTMTSGELQVHNAQSVALPGYGGADCVVEALFMTGVTVIASVGK